VTTRPAIALLALVAAPAASLAQTDAPAALVDDARTVARQVAAVRELPLLRPVDFRVSDRETIRAYAESSLGRDLSADDWAGQQALLTHLDLLPDSIDLRDLVVRLYTEQVAGYYDPVHKTFYLADWLPRLLQKGVVAHEIVHALQDQHFDLEVWLGGLSPTEDRSLARAAVVEGDAMAAMLAYLLEPAGVSPDRLPDVASLLEGSGDRIAEAFPDFDRAPEALKRLLLFPYVEGSSFALDAVRRGGWDAVDRLYRKPPESSEQILHPERYWDAPDLPRAVVIDDDDGGPGAPIAEGEWGEFGTSLVLSAALGDTAAARAASRGWDGDRYALYRAGDGRLRYLWKMAWDSPAEAERFAAAYARGVTRRFPGSAAIETAAGRVEIAAPGGTVAVRWEGDGVEIRENFD